jgi:hypothetical protein
MQKLYRSLLGVARGGVHPREIALAVLLGVLAGFVQGWNLSLGVVLLAALLLNAPWKMLGQAWATAFGLAWALTPVTFRLGHYLLSETPVGEWLEPHADGIWIVLLDLDRYTLLGGLVLAPLIAVPAAVTIGWATHLLQVRFQNLQEKIQANQHWQASRAIRFACWLLLGSMAKAAQGAPKPRWFRPVGLGLTGVVIVPLLGCSWFYLPGHVQGGILRGLMAVNQAEVNVQRMDLSLSEGTLAIEGLRMADPRNLDQDRLRIDQLAAVLKPGPLLRGQVLIEQVRVDGLACDVPRERRAKPYALGMPLFDGDDEPADSPAEPGHSLYALPEYMPDWKPIEGRLQQVKQLVERVEKLAGMSRSATSRLPLSRSAGDDSHPREAADDDEIPQAYRELRAKRHAFGQVRPRVWVQEVRATHLAPQWGLGDDATIQLTDLASDPRITRKPARLLVVAREGQLKADVQFNLHRPGMPHDLAFEAREVPLQKLVKPAKLPDTLTVTGGKLTLSGKGTLTSRQIDLPLRLTAKELDVKVGGTQPKGGLPADLWNQGLSKLGGLEMPSRLSGGWRSPRLRLNAKELAAKFQEQLRAAGHEVLAHAVEQQLAKGQQFAKEAAANAKAKAEKIVQTNVDRGIAVAQDTVKSELDQLKQHSPLDKLASGSPLGSGNALGSTVKGLLGDTMTDSSTTRISTPGSGALLQPSVKAPDNNVSVPPAASTASPTTPGAVGAYTELRPGVAGPPGGYPDPYALRAQPSSPAVGAPFGSAINTGSSPIPGSNAYNLYPSASAAGGGTASGTRNDSPYPPYPNIGSTLPYPAALPDRTLPQRDTSPLPSAPYSNTPYPNTPYPSVPSYPNTGASSLYPSMSSPYPTTTPELYPRESGKSPTDAANATNQHPTPKSPYPDAGALRSGDGSAARDGPRSTSAAAGSSGSSYDFYEDDPPPVEPRGRADVALPEPGGAAPRSNPAGNVQPLAGPSLSGPPLPQASMPAPGSGPGQAYDPLRGATSPRNEVSQTPVRSTPNGQGPPATNGTASAPPPAQNNEWRVTRWARGAKDGISGFLFGSSQPAAPPNSQAAPQPGTTVQGQPQRPPQNNAPQNHAAPSGVSANNQQMARRPPPPSPRPGLTSRQSQTLLQPQPQTTQESKPW